MKTTAPLHPLLIKILKVLIFTKNLYSKANMAVYKWCDQRNCIRLLSDTIRAPQSLVYSFIRHGIYAVPVDLTAGRKQFARHEWAQKAAYLLGCTLEELSSFIFKHQPKGTLQRSTSFRQGPDDVGTGDNSGKILHNTRPLIQRSCVCWLWQY